MHVISVVYTFPEDRADVRPLARRRTTVQDDLIV